MNLSKSITNTSIFLGAICFFAACMSNETPVITDHFFDNQRRLAKDLDTSKMNFGETYLSVYSQVYFGTSKSKLNLTATISLRNTDLNNKVYILRANYYNTKGKLIEKYLTTPVFLDPMETIQIVIEEADISGGTGGNFIFEWASFCNQAPDFEAVMISTKSNQGISFVTKGIRMDNSNRCK